MAERLRSAREAQGWTQAELADSTDGEISQGAIGNYEQGTRAISVERALVLAELLNTHAAYLLGLITEDEAAIIATLRRRS